MTNKDQLNGLQMLRALAAILVVFWHSGLAIKAAANNYFPEGDLLFKASHFPAILNHLNIGVDIFFCISGFIMNLLIYKLPNDMKSSSNFFINRCIRILPPYWFFSLLVVLVFFLSKGKYNIGDLSGNLNSDFIRVIFSLLLIKQEISPILAVGWTLIIEFQFYLLCSILILLRFNRKLPEILLIFCLLSVTLKILDINSFENYISINYLEFFFGALLYRFYNRSMYFFPFIQILIAVIFYIIYSYLSDYLIIFKQEDTVLNIIYSLHSKIFGAIIGCLLISGLIGIDFKYSVSNNIFGKCFMRIGDASYSLYLSHWFVLSGMGKVLAIFANAPIFVVILWHLTSIISAILISLFIAEKVELPFHRHLVLKYKNLSKIKRESV